VSSRFSLKYLKSINPLQNTVAICSCDLAVEHAIGNAAKVPHTAGNVNPNEVGMVQTQFF
jgi:hypothetical protein